MTEVLLLVALKTDQPNIKRRLDVILAAAEPVRPDTSPVVFAKDVAELVAADLDALAHFLHPADIEHLRIGQTSSEHHAQPEQDIPSDESIRTMRLP